MESSRIVNQLINVRKRIRILWTMLVFNPHNLHILGPRSQLCHVFNFSDKSCLKQVWNLFLDLLSPFQFHFSSFVMWHTVLAWRSTMNLWLKRFGSIPSVSTGFHAKVSKFVFHLEIFLLYLYPTSQPTKKCIGHTKHPQIVLHLSKWFHKIVHCLVCEDCATSITFKLVT